MKGREDPRRKRREKKGERRRREEEKYSEADLISEWMQVDSLSEKTVVSTAGEAAQEDCGVPHQVGL